MTSKKARQWVPLVVKVNDKNQMLARLKCDPGAEGVQGVEGNTVQGPVGQCNGGPLGSRVPDVIANGYIQRNTDDT